MGKIRIRQIGVAEIEDKEKKEAKKRAYKKRDKKKVKGIGLKGGERVVQIEVDEAQLEKEKRAKKSIEEISRKTAEKQEKVFKIKHKRGRKYLEAKKKLDDKQSLSIKQAISLLKKISYCKFDEAVELHINTVKAGLRGEVEFPHQIGKKVKVRVVDDNLLADLEKGQLEEMDILVSHPSYMSRLAKFARILGPKRLIPNPKAGTVSKEPEKLVKRFSTGLIRWKTESKFPLIHQMVGRLSFSDKVLEENVKIFIKAVGRANIAGAYIKSTMSPSIKLSLKEM